MVNIEMTMKIFGKLTTNVKATVTIIIVRHNSIIITIIKYVTITIAMLITIIKCNIWKVFEGISYSAVT